MAPEGDTTVNGIVLSAPEAGAELTQQVAPGATVDLGNLMEQVTSLAKDGNNFILTFENGGKIILQDFFPADAPEGTPTESTATTEPTATDPALASAGPSLIIDGQEVPYDMFMANYGDSIEAAAGPATATAVAAGLAGSGIGSYADGLGGEDSIVDFKSTDTIDLRDLFSNFGEPKDLDGLLNAGHIKFDQNTDNEKAIDIKISSDDLNNGGSVEQIITVNFAEHDSQSYDELQAMLQLNILTNSNQACTLNLKYPGHPKSGRGSFI